MAVTAQSAEFGTKFNSFCVKCLLQQSQHLSSSHYVLFYNTKFGIPHFSHVSQASLDSASNSHRSIKMYFILMKTNQQGSICEMFTSALAKTKFPLKS